MTVQKEEVTALIAEHGLKDLKFLRAEGGVVCDISELVRTLGGALSACGESAGDNLQWHDVEKFDAVKWLREKVAAI